jgi:hypothetical protein
MVDNDALIGMLTRLKLTAIRDQLDSLLDEAARRELTLREAVAFLIQREVARKDERRIEMASKIAHFPTSRDLDGFAPGSQSGGRRPALARQGPDPRAGGLSLGRPWRRAPAARPARRRQDPSRHRAWPRGDPRGLFGAVRGGAGPGRRSRQGPCRGPPGGTPGLLRQAQPPDCDPGANAAHLFFQLVSRRYERGGLLITSNRSVGEWGAVFGDPVVATAILDRLLHHSHVITIRGDSYRLREKRRAGLIRPTALPSEPSP